MARSRTIRFIFPQEDSEEPLLYNIGSHSPVRLMDFIGAIEEAVGKKARKHFMPMQPGDVRATYADVEDLIRDVGFKPSTPIAEGVRRFVDWYREYTAA